MQMRMSGAIIRRQQPRAIYIHGALGKTFGRVHMLDVMTAAEAIRALCLTVKGFRNAFTRGYYKVVWQAKRRIYLSREGTQIMLGDGAIHIVPQLRGASSKGVGLFMILAGAALVATAFILAPAVAAGATGGFFGADMSATAISLGSLGGISYGNIATLGFGLMLLGASLLLSPKPPAPPATSDGLFTAPENVSQQGLAVPIVYGIFLVGSIVVSAGISNVNVPVGSV